MSSLPSVKEEELYSDILKKKVITNNASSSSSSWNDLMENDVQFSEYSEEDNLKSNLLMCLDNYIENFIKKKLNIEPLTIHTANSSSSSTNKIELEFLKDDGSHIILRGNKKKYGLIVGKNGVYLNKIKQKFPNVILKIPHVRDVNNNNIEIKGINALKVAYNLIDILN